MVILNSLEAATDLLDKRSAIYSDRPKMYVAGELLGWDQTLVLTPYGDRFREVRRLLFQFFGSRKEMVKFHELAEEETRMFLRRTLQNPDGVEHHIRKYVLVSPGGQRTC